MVAELAGCKVIKVETVESCNLTEKIYISRACMSISYIFVEHVIHTMLKRLRKADKHILTGVDPRRRDCLSAFF